MMNNVVTGVSRLRADELHKVIPRLSEKTRMFRYVCDLERLTVAAVELVLKEAGISIPVGKETIGIYIGIDDVIEDVKNEYLRNILADGLLGASPLLFPFTSPNALAAQATIMFDIRGESIVMPSKGSMKNIVRHADERVSAGAVKMAATGSIVLLEEDRNNYEARFCMIESPESAGERDAKICQKSMELCA